ncbi:MAG: histidine phosphotransferase family protein [Pseudomonadota bacterium]|nr:histidine phosphotransferase family protein [Pseudomonadota bacterium]
MSKDDHGPAQDLVALVGSRICHDLVSPLGAIGNGIELMMLTGGEETPEMTLVNESLVNARERIRFFRIAFGAAADGAVVRAAEIAEALSAIETKAEIDWRIVGDMARGEAKLALLAVNCLASAMPYGGAITITSEGAGLVATGSAERFKIDEDDWRLLGTPGYPSPARVHFALLPQEAAAQGRTLMIQRAESQITLTV